MDVVWASTGSEKFGLRLVVLGTDHGSFFNAKSAKDAKG